MKKNLMTILFLFIHLNLSAQMVELDARAVWQPGMEGLRRIKDKCLLNDAIDLQYCFPQAMEEEGASKQAVLFSHIVQGIGFMRDFREVGKVDIAYAFSPFRANENQMWFLINGVPGVIDVDQIEFLPREELSMTWIFKKYPRANLWPGDRSGRNFPLTEIAENGEQKFFIDYYLKDGCRACKKLAVITYLFEFSHKGYFKGIKFFKIRAP